MVINPVTIKPNATVADALNLILNEDDQLTFDLPVGVDVGIICISIFRLLMHNAML